MNSLKQTIVNKNWTSNPIEKEINVVHEALYASDLKYENPPKYIYSQPSWT